MFFPAKGAVFGKVQQIRSKDKAERLKPFTLNYFSRDSFIVGLRVRAKVVRQKITQVKTPKIIILGDRAFEYKYDREEEKEEELPLSLDDIVQAYRDVDPWYAISGQDEDELFRELSAKPHYREGHLSYKELLKYYNGKKSKVEVPAARFIRFYIVALLREVASELISLAKGREKEEGYDEAHPPPRWEVGNDDGEILFGPGGARHSPIKEKKEKR